MLVNKYSVRWTISFGNDTEIDRQHESAVILNAFLTAGISFFLLICWPSSITKDNRSKILYMTKLPKKSPNKIQWGKGIVSPLLDCIGFLWQVEFIILNRRYLKCSCFLYPKICLISGISTFMTQTKMLSVCKTDSNKELTCSKTSESLELTGRNS